MQRGGLLVWIAVVVAASACGRDAEPTVDVCTQILARRVPEARVVDAVSDATANATLEFEVGAWWERAAPGRLDCSFEEQAHGGLRLQAATLDGVAFTSAERTVINADLLLADLRRADAEARARRN